MLFWCVSSGNPCQYIRITNTDGQWLAFSFLKVLDERSLELDYFIALVSGCCFLSNTERIERRHRLASMNKVLGLIMEVDGVALLAF